jgi:multiple sugar transport system permease protein
LLQPGTGKFIGLENYVKILFDPVFHQAFKNTLLLMIIAVNLELWIGLAVALLLYEEFPGRGIIIPLLVTPMTVAPIVVGLQFKWLFNEVYGAINYILTGLRIINEPLAWLVQPNIALIPILIAEIWQWTPFMILVMMAGLQSVPRDLMEAAEIDGASAFQRFRYIIFSHIKPILWIALTIRSIDVVRIFDVVQIMTGGGPANATEVLGTFIYRTALVDRQFSYGLAGAYIAMLISVLFAWYLFKQVKKVAE